MSENIDAKIEMKLNEYKKNISQKANETKTNVWDFLEKLVKRSDNLFFIIYIFLFFIAIFSSYLFNPYGITSKAPVVYLFSWVILLFLSLFCYAIYKSDNLDFTVIPLYAGEFAYGVGYISIMLMIFCIVFFLTKRLLIHTSTTSVILVVVLFVMCLSLFYKFNSKKIEEIKNEKSSPFISFVFNLLYMIPCLLVDTYEYLVKDIKQAPSYTYTLIAAIFIILLLYYIMPIIQKMKTKEKDAITLHKKATELNRVVVSVTQKEMKEKQIQNKSFARRQILKLNQDFKKRLDDAAQNQTYETDYISQLKKRKVYTSNDDNENLSLKYTLLGNLEECQDANVACTDGNIYCDTVRVQNGLGMYEICDPGEETSFLGKLFTRRERTMDPTYRVDLFRNKDDRMKFYGSYDDKINSKNVTSFKEFCSEKHGGELFNLSCVDFNSSDICGINMTDTFVQDNSNVLFDTSGVFACELINESPDSANKYSIIHGYNDIDTSETAFQCKKKQLIQKSNSYIDRFKNRTDHSEYPIFEINEYVDISGFLTSGGDLFNGRAVIRSRSVDDGSFNGTYSVEMIGGPVINNVYETYIMKRTTEGFTGISTHNPNIHKLDKNIAELDFLGWATPEEQNVLEKALENSNINLKEQVAALTDKTDAEELLTEYLREKDVYTDIINNMYELNLGNNSYLGQETSKLIEMVNRANNIYDINYHYGLSFWVYFDPEILKRGIGKGYILNMSGAHELYYDYSKKELVFTINNCDRLIDNSLNPYYDCSNNVIYKTSKILFQRWNHFVINYSYGTMDLFINNNLVFTQKSVSPMINDNELQTRIQFGSTGENTLDHCGLCNVQYFEIPITLNQIDSQYSKKNNPCK